MTTTAPAKPTLEPVKRVLRTIVALAIALASVLPYIIGQTHFSSQTITLVLSQVTLVSTAITAFAASPAGNYVFGLIGLDATKVTKLSSDVQSTAITVTPPVQAVVAAVEAPSTATVIDAANVAVSAAPVAQVEAQTIASDVTAVAAPTVPPVA